MKPAAILACVLACAGFVTARGEALPPPVVPAQGSFTFSGGMHDYSGTWGTYSGVGLEARMKVLYGGDVEEQPFTLSWGALRTYGHPSGSQYLLLLEHQSGLTPIASYTALDASQGNQLGPMICYPVDNALFGWEMGTIDIGKVTRTALIVRYYFGASRREPGPFLLGGSLPTSVARRGFLTLDFLPGNAVYPEPQLLVSLDKINFNFGFTIQFSDPIEMGSPSLLGYPAPLPYGPVLATSSFDGYSSDSVHWPCEGALAGWWYGLYVPVVPDLESVSPDTLEAVGLNPPESRIVERALEWLLSGRVWHLGNIKPYADRNADRVHDVGDLIRLKRGRGAA